MRYPPELRDEAKELYIRGYSLNQIARTLRDKYRDIAYKASAALIKKWVDRYGWAKLKTAVIQRVDHKLVEMMSREVVSRNKEQLKAYRKMTDTGLTAIEDEKVIVDSMRDAVELIDKGIRGERQVSAGLISLDIIEGIGAIISEEIIDEEAKKRIVIRFKKMINEIMQL